MNQRTHDNEAAFHIRWMIRGDLPQVFSIERLSFSDRRWSMNGIIKANRHKSRIGLIVEHREQVVGWVIYRLFPKSIAITRMAVDPEFRRRGVGSAIIQKLQGKLSTYRRRALTVQVAEDNIAAKIFFAACDFRAVGVNGDTYRFCYRVGEYRAFPSGEAAQ